MCLQSRTNCRNLAILTATEIDKKRNVSISVYFQCNKIGSFYTRWVLSSYRINENDSIRVDEAKQLLDILLYRTVSILGDTKLRTLFNSSSAVPYGYKHIHNFFIFYFFPFLLGKKNKELPNLVIYMKWSSENYYNLKQSSTYTSSKKKSWLPFSFFNSYYFQPRWLKVNAISRSFVEGVM
jgi:hypothetical protein